MGSSSCVHEPNRCSFMWIPLRFALLFQELSHTLCIMIIAVYLEYFSTIAKYACCTLLSSQSCHSVPYPSFPNSKCPSLPGAIPFFHVLITEFSKPLSEEDICELRMSYSVPCTKYTLWFVHQGN